MPAVYSARTVALHLVLDFTQMFFFFLLPIISCPLLECTVLRIRSELKGKKNIYSVEPHCIIKQSDLAVSPVAVKHQFTSHYAGEMSRKDQKE